MPNQKKKFRLSPMQLACVGFAIGSMVIVTSTVTGKEPETDSNKPKELRITHPASRREQESKAAFLEAYKVFTHPRCMNCHPSGDAPLQGDDSHIHLQNVTRGPDGKGIYAMKCKNCHQDANVAGKDMPPGSPGWSMPPSARKMVFQGKSAHELALHFKDNRFTGFKSLNDMLKHVEEEPLVLTGWNVPEGYTKPPLSHEEFVAKVKEWIEKGAVAPD